MFKGININNAFYKLIFFVIVGLYIIFIANALGKPLVQDDWWNRSAAESIVLTDRPQLFGINRGLLLGHPPLYLYIVALFFKILGIGDLQARLAGIIFFILNLSLVFSLAKNLYPKNRFAPILSLLFFGLSPIAIQGSLMIDIDQNLLTFSGTLFFYCFLRLKNLAEKKRILILALIFFSVLCSKLSLPPLILLSLVIYYALKREFIKKGMEILGIAFLGAGLFLLSWWAYCFHLDFMAYFFEPFRYIFYAFFSLQVEGNSLQKLAAVGINLLRISFWTTPSFLLLSIFVIGKQMLLILKEKNVPRDFILSIFVFIVFIGYLFVGGLTFGFPRNHAPMMPVLAVLIGGNLPFNFLNKNILTKLAVIVCIVLLGYLLLVGDIIYLVHYSLKEALIYNFRLGFANFIFPLLLYIISPLLVLGTIYLLFRSWLFTHKFLFALVITTLAASLSLDILQTKADYFTTAEYGGRGKIQMLNFLKDILGEDDSVFSTAQIIYDLRLSKPIFPPLETWSNPESFLAFIRKEKPKAIIYGVPLNTIGELKRTLLNPLVLELLKRDYKREDIGSYTVWVKK